MKYLADNDIVSCSYIDKTDVCYKTRNDSCVSTASNNKTTYDVSYKSSDNVNKRVFMQITQQLGFITTSYESFIVFIL